MNNMDWESSPYRRWYTSHRRFSFTAHYCIDLYEDGLPISDTVFRPFLRSLACHSKAEEHMFQSRPDLLVEHTFILPSKSYTQEEKYEFCKMLLVHMREEEAVLTMNR